MGKNTGNKSRKGAVIDRSQMYNDKTGLFIKRDTTTGKFMAASETKFKGVTLKESSQKKTIIKK